MTLFCFYFDLKGILYIQKLTWDNITQPLVVVDIICHFWWNLSCNHSCSSQFRENATPWKRKRRGKNIQNLEIFYFLELCWSQASQKLSMHEDPGVKRTSKASRLCLCEGHYTDSLKRLFTNGTFMMKYPILRFFPPSSLSILVSSCISAIMTSPASSSLMQKAYWRPNKTNDSYVAIQSVIRKASMN